MVGDDVQVTDQEVAAPAVSGEVESKPADQDEATPLIPKQRLDQEIEKTKAERLRSQALEARVQALESSQKTTTDQKIPTLHQILQAYDAGQLTETVKDQWVAYHAKEDAKREFGKAVTEAAVITKAQATSVEYVKAMPALNDMSSREFQELSGTYRELLSQGHPDHLATQAMALRMTFGPLKRVTEPASAEPAKARADTFLEGSGGGGRVAERTDPLKDVSPQQIAYWKSKGYSKADMEHEAKFAGVRNLREFRKIAPKKSAEKAR